jgi:hypothetical protein
MEKIKVTIKKDGSIEYTVHGVKGKLCKMVSAFIDKMGRVMDSKNTAEYNQSEDPTQKERYKQ